MLWTATPKDETNPPIWEPLELTVLKQKLAQLSCHICKCLTDRQTATTPNATPKAVTFKVNPNDKDVQVGRTISFFNRFTQATENDIRTDQDQNTNLSKTMCPSCYVTMNLLREGRLFRVLKDEESETKAETCDKSTEKLIETVEKTTSLPFNQYDNNELCHVVNYSDTSFHDVKLSSHVKFWDVTMNADSQTILSPPCVCLDKLIESIRPSPILNTF